MSSPTHANIETSVPLILRPASPLPPFCSTLAVRVPEPLHRVDPVGTTTHRRTCANSLLITCLQHFPNHTRSRRRRGQGRTDGEYGGWTETTPLLSLVQGKEQTP